MHQHLSPLPSNSALKTFISENTMFVILTETHLTKGIVFCNFEFSFSVSAFETPRKTMLGTLGALPRFISNI